MSISDTDAPPERFRWLLKSRSHTLIGTYLLPAVLIGDDDQTTRERAPEIATTVSTSEPPVKVTRMGGLFVERPHDLPSLDDAYQRISSALPKDEGPIVVPPELFNDAHRPDEKREFAVHACTAMNDVVCELALVGHPTTPIAPHHLLPAGSDGAHAITDTGFGAGDPRSTRVRAWLDEDQADDWREGVVRLDDGTLNEASKLDRARRLREISPSLPEFVAAAFWLYASGQVAECMNAAWIVCEQIVDHWWKTHYVSRPENDGRDQSRLNDSRTFTAAVQIETLFAAEVIDSEIRRLLHEARKSRNDMAHRALVSLGECRRCVTALIVVLANVLGTSVSPPVVFDIARW